MGMWDKARLTSAICNRSQKLGPVERNVLRRKMIGARNTVTILLPWTFIGVKWKDLLGNGMKIFVVTFILPISFVYSNSTGGGAASAVGWPDKGRDVRL